MESVFIRLFNVGVSAAWLVFAVVAARLVLRRAPKWTRVLMWALVGLRLALPFSIESAVSLVPSAETIPRDVAVAAVPQIRSGIASVNAVVNPYIRTTLAPTAKASVNPMQTIVSVASAVWLCGVAAMLLYALASYVRLRILVREAVFEGDRVWTCDRASSPFILGAIRPRIILPSALDGGEREMILAHERSHLRRFDHVWKPLGFILLAVNWYNPAIWLAYILLCRDVELACDERVIRTLGAEAKADYSRALIENSIHRRQIAACPLAFGEVGIRERVKNVLSYKKPALWIIIAAIALCAALAVCFLTDPKDGAPSDGAASGETDEASGETQALGEPEIWQIVSASSLPSADSSLPLLTLDRQSGEYALVCADRTEFDGKFTDDGDELALVTRDGGSLVFRKVGDLLVYDEARSDSKFRKTALSDKDAFIRRTEYSFNTSSRDIDRDGVAEILSVGPGYTSGNFSFIVRATDPDGNEKYRAMCICDMMSDFWFGYSGYLFPTMDSLGAYGVFGHTAENGVRFFEIGFKDGGMTVEDSGIVFNQISYDIDSDGTEETLRAYMKKDPDGFKFTVEADDADHGTISRAQQKSERFVSIWFGRNQPVSPELSSLGPFGVFGRTEGGETRFYEIKAENGKITLNEAEDQSENSLPFTGAEPIATIRYRLEGDCVLPHEYNSGVVAVYPGSAENGASFCVTISDADITTGEPVSPSQNIIFLDEFACKYDSLVFLYPDGSVPLTSSTGLPAGYPILRLSAKGVVHDYKIEIKQGHIVLSENGLKLSYYVPEAEIGKEITISDDAEVWVRSSDAPDGDPSAAVGIPRILIDRENGTYQITLNAISSYIGIGNFKERNDALILCDYSGCMSFVFKKVGDTLVYDEPESDAYTYGAFANGAIFRKVSP